MTALWLGIGIGIAGSLHCAAMCGPVALAAHTNRPRTSGQVAYHLGRINMYVLLGLVLGALSQFLFLGNWQRGLSVFLGLFLISYALFPKVPFFRSLLGRQQYLIRPLRNLFTRGSGSMVSQFSIGLLNGLLPCGLVYSAVALATAMDSITGSALLMAGFGLGTSPVLIGVVQVANRLKPQSLVRTWLPLLSVALGVILVFRGLALDIPYLSPVLQNINESLSITVCH